MRSPSTGVPSAGGLGKMGDFRLVCRYISETVQDRNIVTTCRRPIRNRMWSVKWYRVEWPWVTLTQSPSGTQRARAPWESRALCAYCAYVLVRHRPTYLSADIRLVSEQGRPHLRSSSHRTLLVPRTPTSFGDRSFAAAGRRLWNTLPANLRQTTSYGRFRRHLKAHLFTAYKSRRIVAFVFRPTATRHASAVYAVVMCLSVCLSVCLSAMSVTSRCSTDG